MDEDIVADLLDIGIPERHAETVARWHAAEVAEHRADATVEASTRVVRWLLDPLPKLWSTRAKAVGIAFAIGRQDLANYETLDDAGEGEGVSHATVANWRKAAEIALRQAPRKESP
jgi:hypothetical protein